ncbi:MAG: type II toxin-antitoxin system prevent-host-death family antitoxin [Gammaproteobacteria bacterium]|nr:type II toxin-antitoxin system prevent-host-death family antitoxin [Gammaproteobacteria bacterium]
MEIDVRQVAATEAKARLAELLREVEYGGTVAITRHGRTVAHLTPPRDQERETRQAAVARFRAWRERRRPVGMTTDEILDLIREGRRF